MATSESGQSSGDPVRATMTKIGQQVDSIREALAQIDQSDLTPAGRDFLKKISKRREYAEYTTQNLLGMTFVSFVHDYSLSDAKEEQEAHGLIKDLKKIITAILPLEIASKVKTLLDRQTTWSYTAMLPYAPPFRSEAVSNYVHRIIRIVIQALFYDWSDFDLAAHLLSDKPDEQRVEWLDPNLLSGLIALEIDAKNAAVLDAIRKLCLEDNDTGMLSQTVLIGMAKSRHPEIITLLGRLLLAARLQEGLRQAILESANKGSIEALVHLMEVVLENDLLRFSSVQQAVCVWTGLGYADRRVIEKVLRLAHHYLVAPEARRKGCDSRDAIEIYTALWAAGVQAVETLAPLVHGLMRKEKYQRMIALAFLGEVADPASRTDIAAEYLDDEDLDVVAMAFQNYLVHSSSHYLFQDPPQGEEQIFPRLGDEKLRNRDFSCLMALFERLPGARHELIGKPLPWSYVVLDKNEMFYKLIHVAGHDAERLAKVMVLSARVDPAAREHLLEERLENPRNPEQRDFVFQCLSDKSMTVRQKALQIVSKLQLTPEETLGIEKLLSLKTGEIRQTAIKLLLKQKSPEASIERLLKDKNENRRLGGLDMLMQISRTFSPERIDQLIATMPQVTDKEKILVEKLSGTKTDRPDRKNGFGLYDPDYVPILPPPPKNPRHTLKTLLAHPSAELVVLFASLCDLVAAHKDFTYMEEYEGGYSCQVVLGAQLHLVFPREVPRTTRTIDDYVLPEVWKKWLEDHKPSFQQMFCLNFYRTLSQLPLAVFNPAASEALNQLFDFSTAETIENACQNHPFGELAAGIWSLLLKTFPKESQFEVLEGAIVDMVESLPPDRWSMPLLSEEDGLLSVLFARSAPDAESNAKPILAEAPPINSLMEAVNALSLPDDALFIRKLGLAFRVGKLFGRPYTLLNEIDLARGAELGLLKPDYLARYFMTSKNRSGLLGTYTHASAKTRETFARYPILEETVKRVVRGIIEIELKRGDTQTPVSELATSIKYHEGIETFCRLLIAMKGETFVRGYIYSNELTKRSVLSGLLKSCRPASEDTAEKLRETLAGRIPDKRLLEAALYSPAWTDLVEQYLGWKGLKSAAWYFHAHTSQDFSAEKETEVARFSSISPERFNDGAFDIGWFHNAYETLGAERFQLLYECARYIAEGSHHRRAQIFADAVLGRLEADTLEKEITEKRIKDRLLAYSLIPLAKQGDALKRYEFIQNFFKESKKFGAQRQESERKTVEIALENLARNAGFQDANRFSWHMEKEKVAQIDFEPVVIDGVSLRLNIDDSGQAEISCEKAGKTLKSIPSALSKNRQVTELKQIRTSLKDQYKRARRSLESAMENADPFTGSELVSLQSHPVIWPLLSKLVFLDGKRAGFPVAGKLVSPQGDTWPIRPDAQLLIAHPADLYRTGSWSVFQKHVFTQQIVQPFKQVFRELYRITDDERRAGTVSQRYAGHQVQPRKTLALLKGRGWTVDHDEGLQKVFFRHNLIATIEAAADWFSPAEIENPTLENVGFYNRRTLMPVAFDDIPANIFSETMRDIDLVVSVAHAGGVDPETSFSTIEIRQALLPELLALLKIDNVEVRDSHAFITGALGEYTVHLGSGTVHRMGSGAIDIVTVPAQHRGRLFLPFVDDDPRTADILSRILLLANDKKIKDPAILSQIV